MSGQDPNTEEIISTNNVSPENAIRSDNEEHILLSKMFKQQTEESDSGNKNYMLKFLSILFGIGAWVGVTGVFLELPLLVNVTPESWKLSSYALIIVQCANIGPLIYMFVIKKWKNYVNDVKCIYFMQLLSCISAFSMAFYYKIVVKVNGSEHSLVFLMLLLPISLVGCISSVLYIPFMGKYKRKYLYMYMVGEGIGCFITSLAALFQSNGKCFDRSEYEDAGFNIKFFLLFMCGLMMISFASFIVLSVSKKFEREKVEHFENVSPNRTNGTVAKELNKLKIITLMALMAVLCFLGNGILLSVQSYSCLPYGNTAYHLAVSLSIMANPIGCIFSVFWKCFSLKRILQLTIIYSVTSCYILTAAGTSPQPPLVGSTLGIVSIVICWILNLGLMSYLRMCILSIFHSERGQLLVYAGGASQLGAMLGSVLGFLLINYFNAFTSVDMC